MAEQDSEAVPDVRTQLRQSRIWKISGLVFLLLCAVGLIVFWPNGWLWRIPLLLLIAGLLLWIAIEFNTIFGVLLRKPSMLKKALADAVGKQEMESLVAFLRELDPNWIPESGPERARYLIAIDDISELRKGGEDSVAAIGMVCTDTDLSRTQIEKYYDLLAEIGGEHAISTLEDAIDTMCKYVFSNKQERVAFSPFIDRGLVAYAALAAHGHSLETAKASQAKRRPSPEKVFRSAVPDLWAMWTDPERPTVPQVEPALLESIVDHSVGTLSRYSPELRAWLTYELRVTFLRQALEHISPSWRGSRSLGTVTTTVDTPGPEMRQHWIRNINLLERFLVDRREKLTEAETESTDPWNVHLPPDDLFHRVIRESVEASWEEIRSKLPTDDPLGYALATDDFDARESLVYPAPKEVIQALDAVLQPLRQGEIPAEMSPMASVGLKYAGTVTGCRFLGWLPGKVIAQGFDDDNVKWFAMYFGIDYSDDLVILGTEVSMGLSKGLKLENLLLGPPRELSDLVAKHSADKQAQLDAWKAEPPTGSTEAS